MKCPICKEIIVVSFNGTCGFTSCQKAFDKERYGEEQ